ncbi:MAG TPA: c-type cytochrome domain-containing protein [Candidatus Acidoferrum sp.]|nr:c-type cytochrome domain-containing protein [Candidatus Acidoferrum sp.]
MRVLLAVAVGASVSTRVVAAPDLSKLPPPASQEGLTYAKDIKPFFEASCVRCHSGQKAKAGLHLDSLEGVLNGSKDGKVITPGESAKSKLVIAVARLDPESAMPPKPKAPRGHPGEKKGEGGGPAPSGTNSPAGKKAMGPPPKPLTPEQVGLVRAWVDQGAK